MRRFGYRTGIGRALLDDYVGSAELQGFTHLTLSSPARLLYERAGFVCMGVDSHDYHRYERRK